MIIDPVKVHISRNLKKVRDRLSAELQLGKTETSELMANYLEKDFVNVKNFLNNKQSKKKKTFDFKIEI